MVDRHDIDALLIGSLYGELSSADEARLRAHLESHPADRTAFDGLSRTRQAVRASRIFEVQLEPPQSVSALLLQEAARRAPRKAREEDAREGWFARLRRSFLMHPAMAAAAMFVVVLGVAGTIYMRKGDHFAAPEASAPAEHVSDSAFATAPAAPSATAALEPAPPNVAPMPAPAADSEADQAGKLAKDSRKDRDLDGSFRVRVLEGEANRQLEEQAKPAVKAKAEPPPSTAAASANQEKEARQAGPRSMLEVTTPRLVPKEMVEDPSPRKTAKGRFQADDAKPVDSAPAPAPAEAAKQDNMTTKPAGRAPAAVPPAPSAPDRGFSRAPSTPSGGAGGAVGGSGGEEKMGVVDANLAWAQEQHSRLVDQVKAGRCTDAASTAVSLSSRAPGYYEKNVEGDRDVKTCLAYINAERDKAQRARATVRRAPEEAATVPAQPAPAPPKKVVTQKKAAPPKSGAGAATKSAPAKADTSAKEAPATKN